MSQVKRLVNFRDILIRMNPYIDLHAHLNFKDFDTDREQILAEMKEKNVIAFNIGTTYQTSKEGVELAEKYPEQIWALIGSHPVHAPEHENDAQFEEFFTNSKVIGIGECGLDYFERGDVKLTPADLDIQEKVFRKQIEWSIKYNKPLMLHVRQAYRKTLDILKEYFNPSLLEYRGNAHFFVGTLEEARAFLDLGFSISFTGVITFVEAYRELVEFVPLDHMFAETDSPYVSPVPHRGKRNSPLNVIEIYKKIAEIKKVPLEEVINTIASNARKHWLKV
jgi:TatD DNase family protein